MNYILYVAVGDNKYKAEAIYSILSYMKTSLIPAKIIVLSDDADAFTYLLDKYDNIMCEQLPMELITSWKGSFVYPPRMKVKAIQYILYKHKGNVIFIDTDTFILEDINNLFTQIDFGKIVFHSRRTNINNTLEEYVQEDPDHPLFSHGEYELYQDIEKNGIINDSKDTFHANVSNPLFNSGVIGISARYLTFLDDVLKLSDLVYRKYKGYWCAEEFAFSIIFNRLNDVITCDEYIHHYFNAKVGRLLLPEHLNYLHDTDVAEYENVLSSLHLKSFNGLNDNYQELPYLIHFVQHYLMSHSQADGIEHKTRAFGRIYEHEKSFQYKVRKDYSFYKKHLLLYNLLEASYID